MLLTLFVFLLLRVGLPNKQEYRIFEIFQHHATKYAVVSATKVKVIIAFQTSKHHVKGARVRTNGPLLTLVTGGCRGWMTTAVALPFAEVSPMRENPTRGETRVGKLVAPARGCVPASMVDAGFRGR